MLFTYPIEYYLHVVGSKSVRLFEFVTHLRPFPAKLRLQRRLLLLLFQPIGQSQGLGLLTRFAIDILPLEMQTSDGLAEDVGRLVLLLLRLDARWLFHG